MTSHAHRIDAARQAAAAADQRVEDLAARAAADPAAGITGADVAAAQGDATIAHVHARKLAAASFIPAPDPDVVAALTADIAATRDAAEAKRDAEITANVVAGRFDIRAKERHHVAARALTTTTGDRR